MRIAILADFPVHKLPELGMLPPAGHYATWLPQLADAFEEAAEHEIHWLTIVRQSGLPPVVRWRNQSFHLLRNSQKLRALRFYARDRRLIQNCLAELKPDLVHAWGTEDCYAFAAAFSGCPTLTSVQGILSHYIRMAPMHPLVRIQSYYERLALDRARNLTAESPWACEILRPLAPKGKITRVDYGVPELFYNVPWSPDPAKPVALFVGTPDRRKGIEDAVEAFGRTDLAAYELWIVGDGGLTESLKEKSTLNVKWLGRKSVPEVTDLMSRAWCLVIPTRADTGPTVVKEARVVGLPVLTTKQGGQRDYIEEAGNGAFAAPGDVATLTTNLQRILSNFELTRKMGAFKHDEQRAFFRPENTAREFLGIYGTLFPH